MSDQTTSALADDPLAERKKRIAARREMLAARMPKRQRVRVNPADDDVRKLMKHPSGIRFPKSGSAEWPFDRFTRRRIDDGSVKLVDGEQRAKQQPPRSPSPGPAPHRTF